MRRADLAAGGTAIPTTWDRTTGASDAGLAAADATGDCAACTHADDDGVDLAEDPHDIAGVLECAAIATWTCMGDGASSSRTVPPVSGALE